MKYYYITSYQYDGVFSSIDVSSKEFFLIGLCVFLILLFGTIALSGAISRKKQKAAILENETKLKSEVESLEAKFVKLYGPFSKSFYWKSDSGELLSILLFEKPEVLVIQNKEYRFNEIISVNISDESQLISSTSVTKADTSDLIFKSMGGGMAFGALGTLVGGSNANKNTTTRHNSIKRYQIHIMLNSLANPSIMLFFNQKNMLIFNNFSVLLSGKTTQTKLTTVVYEIYGMISLIVKMNSDKKTS